MKTLWEVWRNELTVSYDKSEAFALLENHWQISQNATFNRMKQGKFTVQDVRFFWEKLCIAFDYERGFFFDTVAYQRKKEDQERKTAKRYGLVSN